MIPHMVLPKGTVIRVGNTSGLSKNAIGAEIELNEVKDYPRQKLIVSGRVLKSPNGWLLETMTHSIKDIDELVSLPGANGMNNESATFLLRKEFI